LGWRDHRGAVCSRTMTADLPPRIIAAISFVGRGGGQVKALAGFKKGHHSIPDAANPVTNAFLGKICAPELADEAEQLFQAVRSGMGYKRQQLSLNTASPTAVLTAKDFVVEIVYALEEAEPARYAVTTTMRDLRDMDVARGEAFARIFAAKFAEISFGLKKGAKVEAVVDAIEGLDGEGGLGVRYPSDCSECTISVEGVDAEVRCTGSTLDMIFPRAGAPAELVDAFGTVRDAFQISKPLAGLIA
jgi:hypothetical protein